MSDHPLTDDICSQMPINSMNTYDDMRAAADWQLEEVKRKVELKLTKCQVSGYADVGVTIVDDAIEVFFEEIMQELRPQQQQQENNQ